MREHWLSRLLSPASVAIVGASERFGSLAANSHRQLLDQGFSGKVYSVNPRYTTLFDKPCYPDLTALPEVPDLVLYAISGLGLEKSFDQALALGVGGMVIYASNHVEGDADPPLPMRLKQKALDAGIPVCGGNSMGFYNYDDGVFVSFDCPPKDRPGGHIGLIAHSGSAMTYLGNNDPRFCYNYVIASGQEINASVGDYMDYLLEQPSTRVIAVFLEAVRNVASFVDALKKAQTKRIPIVITKLGRTQKSAELALSHSGAIVGNHDAFVALCDDHDVILAKDGDEMIVTAMLLAAAAPRMSSALASDGLAGLLDSGGMREQMIDLADDYGLRFADIGDETRDVLREHLEYGLEADNPLDAMGALGRNTGTTYLECGKALLDDADTALLTYEFEFRDGFTHYPVMFEVIDELSKYSEKPLVVINSCTYTSLTETAAKLSHKGIPVINGIDVALRGIRHLLSCHRRQAALNTGAVFSGDDGGLNPYQSALSQQKVNQWKQRFADGEHVDESLALQLLADFSLPVVSNVIAQNPEEALAAAETLGYPVVLKTAQPGIHHKSDQGGVKLGIGDEAMLRDAYGDLLHRLGQRVLIMPMAQAGVELSIGMKNDPQFGPLIILAAGGVLIELLNDRACKLAPIDAPGAHDMIEGLKVAAMLKGLRGSEACNVDSLIQLIRQFSWLMVEFADVIGEVDMNPVIINQSGCTIVDALVVPKNAKG